MFQNDDLEDIYVPEQQSKGIQDYNSMISQGSAPKNPEFDQGMVNFKNCSDNNMGSHFLKDHTKRSY